MQSMGRKQEEKDTLMKPRSRSWSPWALTLGLAVGLILTPLALSGQQTQSKGNDTDSTDYSRSEFFPNVFAPYVSPRIPELQMSNSERLHSLIQDGKLKLSVQDAIALALENNLDINISRYQLRYAQTDLLRTRSGNSYRGINPAFFGGVTAFGGGGGGGSTGGTGGAGGITGGGGANQVTQVSCCDPFAGMSFGWDQRTTPLNNTVVTGVANVISQQTNVSAFYGQGFLTGTSYVVALSGFRASTTQQNTLFNPYVPTSLTVGFNQKLLNGFGYRANARFIRIAKNGVARGDSVFRQQVMTTVTTISNLYSDLVSYREQVRVAEQALAYAQKLLSDNKRQVEIGTLAPIEVVRAESEVAARQQDLIVAQTNYLEQQEKIKTALSKHVDPDLAAAQVDATDELPSPIPNDIPPLGDALKQAEVNRPEITQAELNIRDQEITIQAARNGLLPSLDVFATYAPTGLSGNRFLQGPCPAGFTAFGSECFQTGGTFPPTSFTEPLPGTTTNAGLFQSLTQVFHGRYPDYSFGVTLSFPIRNRSGQADMATALLQERQLRTQMQQQKNNIAQDVRNAVIAVTQAKAQIEAAHKAVILAQQTLDAEQKKFQLGESTVFNVIQTQRDLVTAQGTEVLAHSTYAKAMTQYYQATGTTLQHFNIELADAKSGQVNKAPNIPGTPISTQNP
jgi:outer membrane protein